MTNFFEHQQAARTRTFWLICLFILAVLATTLLVYPLAVLLTGHSEKTFYHNQHDPSVLLGSFAGVWGVIGLGSLWKASQLSGGGKSVALMVGGQPILASTRDARERRLLNIVEEMALASGLPMPAVYVLPNEPSINAFAAGLTPGDAVVAVSRGSLDYLTRDELQGVVAHEFSHILNGDMRINFRMIIVIAGLIGLFVVGRVLLESASRGRSSNSKNDGRGAVLLLGLGLLIIGAIGAFFGHLMQAAISRQREYLADASAVQFTRNPDGIGGALKKIGAFAKHGQIQAPEAAEAAHLFFAEAFARFTGLFATHPSLEDRIRRILPDWDGTYPDVSVVPEPREEEKRQPPRGFGLPALPGTEKTPLGNVPVPVVLGLAADESVDRAGTVPSDSSAYARQILASLPARLREAIAEPFQARAVVFSLLLDRNPEVRERQLTALQDQAERRTAELTLAFQEPLKQLPEALRLPLVDLCVPTLRLMSDAQYATFRELVIVLTEADGRLGMWTAASERGRGRRNDPASAWSRRTPRPSWPTWRGRGATAKRRPARRSRPGCASIWASLSRRCHRRCGRVCRWRNSMPVCIAWREPRWASAAASCWPAPRRSAPMAR